MNGVEISWIVILGIALTLCVLWYLLCIFFAQFSGWKDIASAYTIIELPKNAEVQNFVSGVLCGVEYKGVLHVYINELGLGLKTIPLYRMTHPPVFIPWHRIRIIELDDSISEKKVTFEILGNQGESLARLILPAIFFKNFQSFLMYT
jgi:hypothetical protein